MSFLLNQLIFFFAVFCFTPAKAQLNKTREFKKEIYKEQYKAKIDNLRVVKNDIIPKKVKFIDWDKEIQTRCEQEVRLDEKGFVMHDMNETWQESGTCYAHAALQLYDSYRKLYPKNKEKFEQSSVAHISYLFKKHGEKKQPKNFYGGNSKIALDVMSSYPPCPIQATQIVGTKTIVDKQEKKIENVYDSLKIAKEKFKNNQPKDSMEVKKYFKDMCTQNSSTQVQFEKLRMSYKEITNFIDKSDVFSVVEKAGSFNCKKKNVALPYQTSLKNIDNKNRSRSLVNILEMLSKGPKEALPIQLSFCSNRAYSADEKAKSCGSHAVVVAGKRYNKQTKECELLIQDSGWPATFKNNVVKRDKPKSQKLWISANRIIDHSYRYTTIAPKK